ncbi:hypothetical protein U3516DRAFT_918617 [Neocallimastix sp. 'constans']|jgi:uncharacterized membrane protein YciS (DUF1049 family)
MIDNKRFFNICIYFFLIISKVLSLSQLVRRDNDTVKTNIDTVYGSIEIEYVKKEKEDHFKLKLMIYLSALGGMLVLVCLIHSIVYIRPKYIKKKNERKMKRKLTKGNKEMSMTNSSSNSLNTYGMEEIKDARLKDASISPEDSIDNTYNASSTDCIINLDNNNSKNRRKSSGSKKSYRKKL